MPEIGPAVPSPPSGLDAPEHPAAAPATIVPAPRSSTESGPPRSGWRARALRPISWQLFALCIAYVLYVYYWTWITVQRFYSLNAYVYDLGFNMEQLWAYWHQTFTPVQVAAQVFDTGIQYLFSPLALAGSYPLLLACQSIFVGISCFAIYGIAKHALGDRTESLLLAGSYLIFFPLAGANWLDFEFLGLFAPLFLFGYFAYQRRSYWGAFILLTLCGTIRFPFALFPLLFAVTVILEPLVRPGAVDDDARRRRRFGWALGIAATIFLLGGFFISLPVTYNGELALNLHATGGGGPSVSSFDLLLTLVLVLAPLLFLPLFSPRWVIFLVPYTTLLFVTQFWAYSYPYAFRWEYAPTLVPFVYLGLIDCLAHPGLVFGPRAAAHSRIAGTLRSGWRARYRLRVTVSVVIIVALLALVYQPYGPFNSGSFNDFELGSNTAVNASQWANLNTLIRLIPADEPYVLFQDNMPEVLPRPQVYPTLTVTGPASYGTPITPSEAVAGRFPMVQNGTWTTVRVDYVISDPYSWTFLYGTPSMAEFDRALYSSGAYGIVGEADGMMLLEHNYAGLPQYYQPYVSTAGPGQLFQPADGSPFAGTTISATNTGGGAPLWNGPYDALVPGEYTATLQLRTSNRSAENAVQLQVLADQEATDVLDLQSLQGSNFTASGEWQNVSLDFYVSAPVDFVQVIARSLGWNGTLSLRDITVRQTAVGAPTVRAGISTDDNVFYQLLGTLPPSASLVVQPVFDQGILGRTVWTPASYASSDDATYLLGDPFAAGFSCGACTNGSAMAPLLNASLASGTYGLLDEVGGVVVLERGYAGPLADYAPLDLSFDPADLYNGTSKSMFDGPVLSANDTSGNVPLWNGPYTALVPGQFQLTFQMASSTVSPSARLLLQALAGPTAQVVLAQQWLTGANFTAPGAWDSISVAFLSPSVYDLAQFIARSYSWSGTIELSAIQLVETEMPR